MKDDDEHIDGEPCSCPSCIEAMNEEMEYHLRSYRLYCVKDDEGNLIDVRDNKTN